MIDTAAKLASLRRELAMRRRVYPRWVAERRMKQEAADHEIAVIEAMIKDYEQIEQSERLL